MMSYPVQGDRKSWLKKGFTLQSGNFKKKKKVTKLAVERAQNAIVQNCGNSLYN